jgi:hypothetical protein
MKALQFGTLIVKEPLTVWVAAVVVVAGVAMVVVWAAVVEELHLGRSGLLPDGSHMVVVGAAAVVVEALAVVVVAAAVAVVVAVVWPAVVALELHAGISGLVPDGSHMVVVATAAVVVAVMVAVVAAATVVAAEVVVLVAAVVVVWPAVVAVELLVVVLASASVLDKSTITSLSNDAMMSITAKRSFCSWICCKPSQIT